MKELIDKEHTQHNIPYNRIMIAGFSQGAAISLLLGLTSPTRYAGIIALSGYLPLHQTFAQKWNPDLKDLPILMCHGDEDQVVHFDYATHSQKHLQTLGVDQLTFKVYQGMGHSACDPEIMDIYAFIKEHMN